MELANSKHKHIFIFEAYDSDGDLKWMEICPNTVVDEGLDYLLKRSYIGVSANVTKHIGLAEATPAFAAGDTMGTHTGWNEVTAYNEANRQYFNPDGVSAQEVNNSGNTATFNINNSIEIGGGFLTDDSTKGGATGTLIGGATFTNGARTLADGDTLNVTVAASASSA